MATDAVAFDTSDDPAIYTGDDMSLPDFCYVWQWPCVFFVTKSSGENLTVSQSSGQIVQKVTVKKIVKDCQTDEVDSSLSTDEVVWEYFTIRPGDAGDATSRAETSADTVRMGFPKNRKTEVEIILEASYHQNITGVTINAQTETTGADGTLSGQPNRFAITLTRKFKANVICCPTGDSFTWECSANNAWENYAESWKQDNTQEIPVHEKRVD